MRRTSSWLPKTMALVVMLMAGAVAMISTDSAGTVTTEPSFVASADFALCDDPGSVASQAEISPAVALDLQAGAAEPVACRRLPECWADSDCDARCGAGLGKCVHSNCPVRICHCR